MPREKAKAETGVLIAERRIVAALRRHTFLFLGEFQKPYRRCLPSRIGRSVASSSPSIHACKHKGATSLHDIYAPVTYVAEAIRPGCSNRRQSPR
jgi:hypothetical protein